MAVADDTAAPRAPTRDRSARRFAAGLALVAVVALAVRLTYTLTVSADLPTIGDAETYHLLARHLADGEGYIRPREPVPVPTAEFPPLFPAILAVATSAGADSILAQKALTSVLGVATVVLVGLLGRRVAGATTGLVAAGLAAAYPMLFQVDGALMAESLYAPLLTGVLLATYTAADRPGPWRWALAGLLTGLAALTRAEALLLVPLLLVPEGLRRAGPDARDRLVAVAAAGAAAALVVTPWVVRNHLRFDRFIPVSNNSGTLLAGANCDPVYGGEWKGQWRLECVTAVGTVGTDEAAAFDRYREAGFRYLRDHAREVPGVVAVRVLRTFGLYTPDQQIAWETFEGRDRTWQTAGHRFFLVLVPFAAGGAGVLRHRRRPLWPLLAPFVLVVAMTAVSYGNQRFRIAAEPALLVLAATGAVALARTLAGRVATRRPPVGDVPGG
jgi:4-amino-4-deoxy-L-arabinose transferase-like glycosyltransferase